MQLLKVVSIDRDTLGDYTFANPSTDTDAVKVITTPGADAAVLRAVVVRPGVAEYPVGEGYRVGFPAHEIPAVQHFDRVQFDLTLVEDSAQDPAAITNVRCRLQDGVDKYTWDSGSSSWEVAADLDTNWSTLEEVNDHIGAWEESTLGFEFELSTLDRRYTPSVRGYRFVYTVDMPSEENDWVYATLVGPMGDSLEVVKDVIVASDGTVSTDFGVVADTADDTWNFVEVVAVYNLDADPFKRTNLLSSYNTGTRIATLILPPADEAKLLVRATYRPIVVVTTDQDYEELSTVPVVMFERIAVLDLGEAPTYDYIMNQYEDPPTAQIFPAGRRCHIDVDVLVWAQLTVDKNRILDAVRAWIVSRKTVTSPTTGEAVTMRFRREPGVESDSIVEVPGGVRSGRLGFRLENVYIHDRPPVEAGDDSPESRYAYGVSSVQAGVDVGGTAADFSVED